MTKEQVKNLERTLQLLDNAEDVNVQNKQHIRKFITYLNAEGKAKTSRQIKYVFFLKRLARELGKDFKKADKQDIIQLIQDIEKGRSLWIKRKEKLLTEWTKHDFRVVLKRFYKWLRNDEIEEYNKTHKDKKEEYGINEYPPEVKWISASMKRERKVLPRQILEEDDLRKLLERTTNNRDRCFIYLLYESGARIGELVSLRIKDIIAEDQYGKKLTVNGKTGERTIRICDSAPSLDIWMREHPAKDNAEAPIFCGINGDKRGKPVDANYFRILIHELGDDAKIKKPLHPHHFRHSAASRYAHTLTEAQLNDYFGWIQGSSQAGTYVHSIASRMDDAILSMHGKKKAEEQAKDNQPKICPRCKTANDHIANVCQICNLGLDKASIMEFDRQQETALKTGAEFIKSSESSQDAINQAILSELKAIRQENKALKQKIESIERK